MKLFATAVTLLCIGVILLLLSFTWSSVVPNTAVWTPEQAETHRKASIKFHNDTFDKSISKIDLQKSKEEFEEINSKLERARATKNTLPIYLRWGGLGAVGVGVAMLLVKQGTDKGS